jgi:hypothetical protein
MSMARWLLMHRVFCSPLRPSPGIILSHGGRGTIAAAALSSHSPLESFAAKFLVIAAAARSPSAGA